MAANETEILLARIISMTSLKEPFRMRVKTFYGWSEKSMDRKINEFLGDAAVEMVDIKFATPIFFFSAMVMYKTADSSKHISF